VVYRKTTAAAAELGERYYTLLNLVRYQKVPAPAKDSSGDFIWSDEDLERARIALRTSRRARTAGVAK
jgi:hypothetical protein